MVSGRPRLHTLESLKPVYLKERFLKAAEGSCELDARLWAQLHREEYWRHNENPLTGTYQVLIAYRGKVGSPQTYNVPMWSQDLAEAWVLAWQAFPQHCVKIQTLPVRVMVYSLDLTATLWVSPERMTATGVEASKAGALLLCAAVTWGIEHDLVPKFKKPLASERSDKPWAEDGRLEEANGDRLRNVNANGTVGPRRPHPLKR